MYDWRILKSYKTAVPVISVGNLSAGGTGKTPFSIWLISEIMKSGGKPAYLSRGYGRKSTGYLRVRPDSESWETGDEAAMVARRFPAATVAVCEDRVTGARRILQESDSNVIILDDAFQHRRIHRDTNIVLIDGNRLPRISALLPAGDFREGPGALRRADLIVFTKTGDPVLKDQLSKKFKDYRIAFAEFIPQQLVPFGVPATGEKAESILLPLSRRRKALAFAGIANFSHFLQTLKECGIDAVDTIRFPDHHPYLPNDLDRINDKFASLFSGNSGSDPGPLVVTTEKDYCRFSGIMGQIRYPAFFVKMETEFTGDRNFLSEILRRKNQKT